MFASFRNAIVSLTICTAWLCWAVPVRAEVPPPPASVPPEAQSPEGDADPSESLLYCSFCGKSQKEVDKIVAGPNVYICDECIVLSSEIIAEPSGEAPADSDAAEAPADSDAAEEVEGAAEQTKTEPESVIPPLPPKVPVGEVSDEERAQFNELLGALGVGGPETEDVHEFTLVGGLTMPLPAREYGASFEGEDGLFVELGWWTGKRLKGEDGVLGGFTTSPTGVSLRYVTHTATVQASALGGEPPAAGSRQVDVTQYLLFSPEKVLLSPISAGPFHLRAGVSGGGGMARMNVPSELATALGGTGTELGDAADEWKFSIDSTISVSLGVRPTHAKGALRYTPSAYYAYTMTNVESEFHAWRYLGHGILSDIGFGIAGALAQWPVKGKPVLRNVVQLLVAGVGGWVEYEVFYDPHNWPWDDPPPMQFSQHQFGLSFLY